MQKYESNHKKEVIAWLKAAEKEALGRMAVKAEIPTGQAGPVTNRAAAERTIRLQRSRNYAHLLTYYLFTHKIMV